MIRYLNRFKASYVLLIYIFFHNILFIVQRNMPAMRPGVVADGMAFRRDFLDHARIGFGIPADQKECRLNAFSGQRGQNFRCGRREGAVVERQCDQLRNGADALDHIRGRQHVIMHVADQPLGIEAQRSGTASRRLWILIPQNDGASRNLVVTNMKNRVHLSIPQIFLNASESNK